MTVGKSRPTEFVVLPWWCQDNTGERDEESSYSPVVRSAHGGPVDQAVRCQSVHHFPFGLRFFSFCEKFVNKEVMKLTLILYKVATSRHTKTLHKNLLRRGRGFILYFPYLCSCCYFVSGLLEFKSHINKNTSQIQHPVY